MTHIIPLSILDTDEATGEKKLPRAEDLEEAEESRKHYNYTVRKTDSIAIKTTELIWEVLKVSAPASTGPKQYINLRSARGESIYIHPEPVAVDGFIALAVLFEV